MMVLSLFYGLIEVPYIPPTKVSPEAAFAAITQAAALYRCAATPVVNGSRAKPFVYARQYAMWLLRQEKNARGAARYSFPAISAAVGLTDHTTAIHAVRTVEARMTAARPAQVRAA